MTVRKVIEPIPAELKDDCSKLEGMLNGIAKDKGFLYRVKEWRPWFYSTQEGKGVIESVKRYTFAGYTIDHGVIRPKTILFASFDTPETHDLKRPLRAADQSRVLGVSYDSFYFHPTQFQEELQEIFPKRYLHIEEMVRRR